MKKIAILLLVHKSPEQLEHLLRRMDDNRFDIYIHVDAKSDINQFKGVKNQVKASEVIFVKERIKTYFNDFSLVKATVNTIKEAISKEYKYYILLTGQDYPIKSNDYIYEKLSNDYPISYIDMYGVEESFSKGVRWVEHIGYSYFSQNIRKFLLNMIGNKLYFSKFGYVVKIIPKMYDMIMTRFAFSPRAKLKNTEYVYSAGSHFWILPDISVKHIIQKFDNDTCINNIFKHIAAPEESYFQTILSSMSNLKLSDGMYDQFSSRRKEMDNPSLRLIKWYENGQHTSGHPAIWKMEDAHIIEEAEALFARKFDINIDSDIINYLDRK